MTRRYRLPALLALSATLGSGACHSNSVPAPERNKTTAVSVPTAVTSARPNATSLKDAVASELKKDPHLTAGGIVVHESNGIVELSGKVDNALSKSRAGRVAEVVRGVRAVSNRIEVAPIARPDSDLERDIKSALKYGADTADMVIKVKVSGGVADLSGTVPSSQARQLAERVALGVRGVRSLNNGLDVKQDSRRDATQIAKDVRSRLAWDAMVEHDPVLVSVNGRSVSLSGSVGSAAEKTRAISDAWVHGVDSVQSSSLQVNLNDRPDPNVRAEVGRTDRDIAEAVRDAASYDPRVRSLNLNPSVTNGIVTLTGTVETLQASRAAEDLARNTVGVHSVNNRLLVRALQPLADRELQKRIEEILVFDPLTDARDIHLSVEKGVVTLTGSVGTFLESAEALDAASRLAGVTRVDDQLQVRDQVVPYVFSTWLDPYDPFGEHWYLMDLRSAASDSDIQQRILAELSWSPFIMPGRVQLRVNHGTATLTGTVSGNRERLAASYCAFAGGASAVDNELKLASL